MSCGGRQVKDNLEALMNTVIPLTQITEEQRDAWESDANAFVTAGTPTHAAALLLLP